MLNLDLLLWGTFHSFVSTWIADKIFMNVINGWRKFHSIHKFFLWQNRSKLKTHRWRWKMKAPGLAKNKKLSSSSLLFLYFEWWNNKENGRKQHSKKKKNNFEGYIMTSLSKKKVSHFVVILEKFQFFFLISYIFSEFFFSSKLSTKEER